MSNKTIDYFDKVGNVNGGQVDCRQNCAGEGCWTVPFVATKDPRDALRYPATGVTSLNVALSSTMTVYVPSVIPVKVKLPFDAIATTC